MYGAIPYKLYAVKERTAECRAPICKFQVEVIHVNFLTEPNSFSPNYGNLIAITNMTEEAEELRRWGNMMTWLESKGYKSNHLSLIVRVCDGASLNFKSQEKLPIISIP